MKRMIAIAAFAVALVAGGGFLFFQNRTDPGVTDLQTALPETAGPADDAGATTEDIVVADMVLGNPDATVEVIEYASYTCPHCASFHSGAYKELKENYIDTGKIKFVYREVYFDKYGMWASLIARCEPAKFFGITDVIYAEQRDWSRAGSDAAIAENLRKIGLRAGVDKDALEGCLRDGDKLRALVGWFQENAERDGIRSTPSFLINGTLYSNMPYSEFASILDGALN